MQPLLGHPLKFVVFKKTGKSIKSEKSDFCKIWQFGGSRCGQNTPTSGGINLPARELPFREKKFNLFLGRPSNARYT